MIYFNRIAFFRFPGGKCPIKEWLDALDKDTEGRIYKRIWRLKDGNLGDCKKKGSELTELRLDFGPGYRIYGAVNNISVLVLFCGGTKATQQKDIKKAIDYSRFSNKGWYYEI